MKYLYNYYEDLNLEVPNTIKDSIDEGIKAANTIYKQIKNNILIPVFCESTIYDIFFTTHDQYKNIQIKTNKNKLKYRTQKLRYTYDSHKDEILVFGEPINLEQDYKTVYESDTKKDIRELILNNNIACVLLNIKKKKNLILQRKIKLLDPRIEIIDLSKEKQQNSSSIEKAYSKSQANFKDYNKYNQLKVEKTFWCQGFIQQLSQLIKENIEKNSIEIKLSNLIKIEQIAYTILYENYE